MLRYLDLEDCNITDDAILKSLRSLSSLRILRLDGNGFNRLPILSGLSQLTSLYLNHCTNLQAIPDLPTSLHILEANYCTELEIMPDLPEMSKMKELQLKDCRKLKDIPNLDNFLCNMYTLHMEGCASLTATFKDNILLKWKGEVIGGLSLSVNDIPRRLPYVDETVEIEVLGPYAFMLLIVPSELVFTFGQWRPPYGDRIRVLADFIETEDDHQIKVKKTGVDIVEWEFIDSDWTNVDYERVPYEPDEEDTDDDTELSFRLRKI